MISTSLETKLHMYNASLIIMISMINNNVQYITKIQHLLVNVISCCWGCKVCCIALILYSLNASQPMWHLRRYLYLCVNNSPRFSLMFASHLWCMYNNVLLSVSLSLLEQLSTGKAARAPKSQDCSHIAFGSKVTGCPPLTARKSSSVANVTESKTHSGKCKLLYKETCT